MSAASPLVSVIIPTYRRSAYLADALQSVFAQTYTDFEVIVVEDGSHVAADSLAKYRDRIRYFWQSNQGVGMARNTGASHARGRWLAFIDDDDLWRPNKLERQLTFAHDHPEMGLLHTDHHTLFDGAILVPERNPPRGDVPSGWVSRDLFFSNFIVTSSTLMRKTVFDRVAGFSSRRDWVEDRDLWLRASRICQIGFMNEPLTIYRDHSDSLSSARAFYIFRANVLESFVRNVPAIRRECGRTALRRSMRNVYWAGGYAHFVCGDFSIARRLFLRAWRWKPWEVRTLIYAAACITGFPGLRVARALKRTLGDRTNR